MKFIGWTIEQMREARDTCGAPNLSFTSGAYKRGADTHDGLTEHKNAITACLRVSPTYGVGPRGGRVKINSEYLRLTPRGHSTGGAVNWSGHFKFMARLYDLNPNGKIVSQLATYESEANFYFTCRKSKDHKVGSRFAPVAFGEL